MDLDVADCIELGCEAPTNVEIAGDALSSCELPCDLDALGGCDVPCALDPGCV